MRRNRGPRLNRRTYDSTPYIYQEIEGRQVQVAGRFVLLDAHSYSLDITAAYDPQQPLVIDPDLAWSTSSFPAPPCQSRPASCRLPSRTRAPPDLHRSQDLGFLVLL